MHVLAFLYLLQGGTPPVLQFPEPGLDDPAAYQGYQTRLFWDSRGNAVQLYLDGRRGRVVHLWADAANESVGFTARDSQGQPAALAWDSPGAVADSTGRMRTLAYGLRAEASPLSLGLFLLGSMRVERDFGYATRDTVPLETDPFPQSELIRLAANLERLDPPARRRALGLLGAASIGALRERLTPRLDSTVSDGRWRVHITQPSFDGKHHMALEIEGDPRTTTLALAGRTLVLRSRDGGPVHITVRVGTDAPALTPLRRNDIFTDDFFHYYDRIRADTGHSAQFRRLEREVRGVELVSSREKLMAGLPNFATYFGRDGMMAALMMAPIWTPAMQEHVISSVLRKLSPSGDASHEEALGGQAIRENAAACNVLLAEYFRRKDSAALGRAEALLGDLAATRENYAMLDDDFQLPVLVQRYLRDPRVTEQRKRAFLLEAADTGGGPGRLTLLARNLAYVADASRPYAQRPTAVSLVAFPKREDGRWFSGSWRDSGAGYANGRFAMDINVIWVPHALEAMRTILGEIRRLGFTRAQLDSLAPALRRGALAVYVRDSSALARAITAWRGTARHFAVTLAAPDVRRPLEAKLAWLPETERAYWRPIVEREAVRAAGLRFLALSLDRAGRPIAVVNTDPATLLFLDAATLRPDDMRQLLAPVLQPYPVGLFSEGLGPVVANDTYAPRTVWEAFRHDAYHSPRVVWGREVNLLLLGLAGHIAAADSSGREEPRRALGQILAAVEASGLKQNELWSYEITAGKLRPVRYGTSSDVQLWNLTDLAVQFALDRIARP